MSRKSLAVVLFSGGLAFTALLVGCVGPAPVHGAVYVDVAPPADQIEVVGVAPSGQHVWIAGHYSWDGHRYVWAGGHWEVRPRERARWVPGRWRRYHGRWYWTEGHWR